MTKMRAEINQHDTDAFIDLLNISRTRKVTTRHPPNEINSIKKYFTPRRDDPEVRRERTEGRLVVVGDCLPCRGDLFDKVLHSMLY